MVGTAMACYLVGEWVSLTCNQSAFAPQLHSPTLHFPVVMKNFLTYFSLPFGFSTQREVVILLDESVLAVGEGCNCG